MKKALILVDIQNDFLPGGSLPVPNGDEVIPVANEIMHKFDLVVATFDSHPEDHVSFALNHPGKRIGDIIDLNGVQQMLWPVHCIMFEDGWQHPDNLNFRYILLFQKTPGLALGMNGTLNPYEKYSIFTKDS